VRRLEKLTFLDFSQGVPRIIHLWRNQTCVVISGYQLQGWFSFAAWRFLLHVNLRMRQPFLRLITYKWSSKPARNQPVDGQYARIHLEKLLPQCDIVWDLISAKKFHNQTAWCEIMATRKTQNLKQALLNHINFIVGYSSESVSLDIPQKCPKRSWTYMFVYGF